MSVMAEFVQSSTIQALGIAALILITGTRLLTNMRIENPLSQYSVQILALTLILPVILTLALTEKFSPEATTGVLGTIVGFFFGGAQGRAHEPRGDTHKPADKGAA